MISDHDFMNTSDLTWSLWTPIIHDQYHTKGPYVWSVIMDDFLLFMHDSGDRHYETLLIIDDHCWSVHHIMHDQWWSCYEKLVIIDDKYWSVHHIMTPILGEEDSLLDVVRKVDVILLEINSQGNFWIVTKFPLKMGFVFGKGDLSVLSCFSFCTFDPHLVDLIFMAALE